MVDDDQSSADEALSNSEELQNSAEGKPTREFWLPRPGEATRDYYNRFVDTYTEAVSAGGPLEMYCTPVMVQKASERWPRGPDGTLPVASRSL